MVLRTTRSVQTAVRPRGRPRGIGAKRLRVVLAAAREELVEFGYAEFRIERVAERAGVHRSTLYRYWQTPSALARDALVSWEAAALPHPVETGAWAADLRAMATGFRHSLASPASTALLRTLAVANAVDRDLGAELLEVWQHHQGTTLTDIIAKAQVRGEVDSTLDPTNVVEMIAAPFVLRALVTRMPIDASFVEAVYQLVLSATEFRPRRARGLPRDRR